MAVSCDNQHRIEWLDIAKGLAVILVIMGHAVQEYGFSLGFLERIIYSFHMPAFFVFSGYLFKDTINKGAAVDSTPRKSVTERCVNRLIQHFLKFKDSESAWDFTKRKAEHLLVPYAVFCGLIFMCHVAKALILKSDYAFFQNLLDADVLVNTLILSSNSAFSNMWFLPSMFSASIIMYFIFSKVKCERYRAIACLILGTAAFIYGAFCKISLPLCLDSACLAVFYMYIGRLIKVYGLEKKFSRTLSIILCAAVLFVINFSHVSADLFYRVKFNNAFLFLISSISGTALLIGTCVRLKKLNLFAGLGRNSLYIYGLHFIVQNLLGFLPVLIPSSKILQTLLVLVISLSNAAICTLILKCFNAVKAAFYEKLKGRVDVT